MATVFGINHRALAVTGLVLTSGIAVYSTYKYLALKNSLYGDFEATHGHSHDSCGEGHGHSHSHECDAEVDFGAYGDSKDSFMALHYATRNETARFNFVPKDAVEFPVRSADICIKHFSGLESGVPSRVLDVGCCVGGISFQLTRGFNEVVGLDYLQGFLDVCNELKQNGETNYIAIVEGDVKTTYRARVPVQLDRSKTTFVLGDACNLSQDLGQFGCILAANLVCRIPKPRAFLEKVHDLVATGGILIIMDHYSWDEMDTEKSEWLGGFYKDRKPVMTSAVMNSILSENFVLLDTSDIPIICPFSDRTFFYMVLQVTVWKKKST